jgi:hypothetical protein
VTVDHGVVDPATAASDGRPCHLHGEHGCRQPHHVELGAELNGDECHVSMSRHRGSRI